MQSRAKLFGHPIHPMLIVFPLGLLSTAAIFDAIAMWTERSGWTQMSFYLILGGIIGGLAAAVFGLIDWLAIPAGTRAKRVGALHGVGNVFVLGLFALSAWMRAGDPANVSTMALTLSFCGLALAVITGWLGGELVDRLGVGVDDGANLNAPSSLNTETVPRSSPDFRA